MTERRRQMEEGVEFEVLVLQQYCEQWLPAKEVTDYTVHIPEHTRSLSGSLLGYKTIP